MAAVALHVIHSRNSKDVTTSNTVDNVHPPPLAWSSSPLVSNVNAATSSVGKNSDTSSSGTDDLPTPKDIISNAVTAIANINKKRRVVWDLRHRSSCVSSPKHRFHPYLPSANTTSFTTSATHKLGLSSAISVSSSSPPARRTSSRHRRTSSKTGSTEVTALSKPRSILKCLRNAKVSQRSSLGFSSPGKRALHASPGGRTHFGSPSASPRRRSSSFTSFTSSPFWLSTRSPGRSPRIPSLSFGSFNNGTKSPSLAEITRANGGGRKHTIAFPDLHAPKPAQSGNAPSSMMMSMASGSSNQAGHGQSTLGEAVSAVNGLFGPSSSNSSLPDGNAGSSNTASNAGLGLGQPFESRQSPKSDEASSNDADPRLHIISACHTLKYSLASAVWGEASAGPSTATPSRHGGASDNDNINGASAVQEDCFDSQPFDFPPRNLETVVLEENSSSPRQAPIPAVHLRELEAAYATIFQYAQVYIQAWYTGVKSAIVKPATATEAESGALIGTASNTQEDKLDQEFAKLAPLVMKCVLRDIQRALNPVPLPPVAPAIDVSTAAAGQKSSPTVEQTKEARQALLHRAGLSNGLTDEEAVVSSSPLAFPSNSPNLAATDDGQQKGKGPEKPKKIGRSTAEMRRRRNEINVVEATLQAFGTLLSCERFWRYFDASTLHEVVCLAAQIPRSQLFKGAKHRDLLSSFNWIIANQTLTVPACNATALDTTQNLPTLQGILNPILVAVMSSIEASTKNGEKARRVLSEGFRAIRTLVLAYPSQAIATLTSEEYIGRIAFFAKYLCSPTKPLRDNAALLLSAIAFGITGNWDDQSVEGQVQKARAQEMVSNELYRYWSLSQDQVEIDELSRHLIIALDSKLASDYHYVRLVVNMLPIILGRRFRKMERKGPHMWLSKAIELKKREEIQNFGATDAAALHLLTFIHVTHAWTASSKEVAGKLLMMQERKRRTGEAIPDGTEDTFWGLGDKALRVIAQNIDTVAAKDWTMEAYKDSANAHEIDATVMLFLGFTYAFTGLAHAVHWTSAGQTQVVTERTVEAQQNPNLQQDLSKLWTVFIGKHLPKLLSSEVNTVRATGWEALHALLRGGEEPSVEDSALYTWSPDRLINRRMLGVYASQASQSLQPIDNVLQESIKPSEIPSLDLAWVYDHRSAIMKIIDEAFTVLVNDATSDRVREIAAGDWIKNEDGHPIMLNAVSNTLRAFFTTIRSALGQEESLVPPSRDMLELLHELGQFAFRVIDRFWDEEDPEGSAGSALSRAGVGYSTVCHVIGLLEQIFGRLAFETAHAKGLSFAGVVSKYVLDKQVSSTHDVQTQSAYAAMVDFALKQVTAVTEPSVLTILAEKVVAAAQRPKNTTSTMDLAVNIWRRGAAWLATAYQQEAAVDQSHQTALPSSTCAFLELALVVYSQNPPPEEVASCFETILFGASARDFNQPWNSLQAIAQKSSSQHCDSALFFAWALLPFLCKVSQVIDAPGFVQQLKQTASYAVGIATTASLRDNFATSLTSGLRNTSSADAAKILLSLKDVLLVLCQADTVRHDDAAALYQTILETLIKAEQKRRGSISIEHASAFFLQCPEEQYQAFADCWNTTYGITTEAPEYSEELVTFLQKVTAAGFNLDNIKTQIDDVQQKEEATQLLEDVQMLESLQDEQDDNNQSHIDVGPINEALEIVSVHSRQNPNAFPMSETDNSLPAYEEEEIPESVETSQIYNTTVENDDSGDEGPAGINSRFDAENRVSPAVAQAVPALLLEAASHEDVEGTAFAEAHLESIIDEPETTQMPPLSQIAAMSALMQGEDSDIQSAIPTGEKESTESPADESFEDTNTSIIPETQPIDAAPQGREIGPNSTRKSEDNANAAATQHPHEPTDTTLTGIVPETQAITYEEEASDVGAVTTTREDSADLSEIEETQVLIDVDHATSLQNVKAESDGDEGLPALEASILPVQAVNSVEESTTDQTCEKEITVIEDSEDENEDQLIIASMVRRTQTPSSPSGSQEPQKAPLVEEASVAARPRLPSPPDTAANLKEDSQPRRKRQIVEVVIPYKAWIPRNNIVSRFIRNVSQRASGSTSAVPSKPQDAVQKPKPGQEAAPSRETARPSLGGGKRSYTLVEEAPSVSLGDRPEKRQKALLNPPIVREVQRASSALLGTSSKASGTFSSHASHKRLPVYQSNRAVQVNSSRNLKTSKSLPTIIHSRHPEPEFDDESDDSLSSSEEEIYVTSSPSVGKRIKQTSDSIEMSKKAQQTRHGSSSEHRDYRTRARNHSDDGPSSSSPTTAASQRIRKASTSRPISATSPSSRIVLPYAVTSSKGKHAASVSSRGTSSTARTGRELARILADGAESEIEEVLEDLSPGQMQKLHKQIEDRLLRVHRLKPVKRKRSS